MRSTLMSVGCALGLMLLTTGPALATVITVTTATDQNGGNPAECSLREAMLAALLNSGVDGCPAGQAGPVVDEIRFNIGGGGVQTITINKIDNTNVALPKILDTVVIDGTTQPGFAGSPLIELRRAAHLG